jgi:hypothetical protein
MMSSYRTRLGWRVLVTLFLLGAGVSAQDTTVKCADCHAPQANRIEDSVHDHITCQECHGGDEGYTRARDVPERLSPPGDNLENMPEFDHGDAFLGAPSRAQTPERCGVCHSDVERMNPYGLRTDQLARYWTSGHGKTLRTKGDDRVAVCTDCHGTHDVVPVGDRRSKTHPLNVPDMCGACHSNASLMSEYDVPVEAVSEYRMSVHGHLLLERGDTGAPTCATCHGNHSAMPPGFATVGAVCGKCHVAAAKNFEESIHSSADLREYFRGCVQCHGGGPDRHFHLIERITNPAGVLIERYEHLLQSEPQPGPERITEAIHSDPDLIMRRVLPSCEDCHEPPEDDESLQKLFRLLDAMAKAERMYVKTGRRIEEVGKGVLLVERERFAFQDAKTHLVELAPLQHTLDNEAIDETVQQLESVCAQVNLQLDEKLRGVRWRHQALIPIWAFAVFFGILLHAKYRQLKKRYVEPVPRDAEDGATP